MRKNKILPIVFIGLISSFTIFSLFKKDSDFSSSEKRNLVTLDDLKNQSFFDQSFQKTSEKYMSDQMIGRDLFISFHSFIDQLIGNQFVSDVYVGKDYLIEEYEKTDKLKIKQYANTLNTFKEKYPDMNMNMMLVPTARSIYQDNMPTLAPQSKQLEDIEELYNSLHDIQTISLEKAFLNSSDNLYYHSDHHWTSMGAKIAFDEYAKMNDFDFQNEKYEAYAIKNDFYGTLAHKSGCFRYPDEITIYEHQDEEDQYRIQYIDSKVTKYSFYELDKLDGDSPYDVFMGGNHSEINIETTSLSESKLLVIKDSYANCFIPFLTPYYQSIYVVDPRYYYEDLSALIEEEGFTDVLFLYNATTFFQDQSLSECLN